MGVDLWAWMTDLLSEAPTRHPAWLISLVEWLPDDGACAATFALRPDTGSRSPAGTDDGPARFLGWGQDRHLQAAIWDLLAAANSGRGKAPTYPRPQRPRRSSTKPSPLAAEYAAVKRLLRKRSRST